MPTEREFEKLVEEGVEAIPESIRLRKRILRNALR